MAASASGVSASCSSRWSTSSRERRSSCRRITAAPPPVALERPQLREEPGREEAGVPPDAAVAQGRDALRLPLPERHEGVHALPPQQRLIRYQKEGPRAVSQGREAQDDAAADPCLRRVVPDGGKGELLCKLPDLWVLRHHHHPGKALRRNCGEGPADEGDALHRSCELVAAEAAGAACRQHHAAGFFIVFQVRSPLGSSMSSISTPAGECQSRQVPFQRRNAL